MNRHLRISNNRPNPSARGPLGAAARTAILLVVLTVALPSYAAPPCVVNDPIVHILSSRGWNWDFTGSGQVRDVNTAFDGAMAMRIGPDWFPDLRRRGLEMGGRQLRFGPWSPPGAGTGLVVTRRAWVPSNRTWVRYVERLENPTSAPITVTITMASNSGANQFFRVIETSLQDGLFNTNDRWIVTDGGGDGIGVPATHFNFAGSGAAIAPIFVGNFVFGCFGFTGVVYQFSVTVPANSTRQIMHFAGLATFQATATLLAQQVDGLPVSFLEGLSDQDRIEIVNWDAASL